MKFLIFLVILSLHESQLSQSFPVGSTKILIVNRIKRQANTATVTDKSTDVSDLSQTLVNTLKKIRLFASEKIIGDVDKVLAAIKSGELQQTLEEIKTELAGDGDIKKIMLILYQKAPQELRESIQRIKTEAESKKDQIHEKFQSIGKMFEDKLKP